LTSSLNADSITASAGAGCSRSSEFSAHDRAKSLLIISEICMDMSGSNAWAEFANLYRLTRPAALDHDRAKTELKALVPEDARVASGHGVRAKRSKSGAISFEVLELEAGHAILQR
jgi:hypothetical protein